MTNINTI